MTDSRAAVGFDRLPWLADEPERPARPSRGGRRDLAGWAVAGFLLVAGASYWLGQQSANELSAPVERRAAPQSTTVPLPAPQPAQPQVQPDLVPEIEPFPAPTVSVPRAPPEHSVARKRAARSTRTMTEAPSKPEKEATSGATASAAVAPKAPSVVPDKPLTLWPSRVSQGASGRLVQIGAFGTRLQAKLGWRHMVRAYPGVSHLPAVVVEARNSRGRRFYRFQIGTTSQAHSEVLCQRMQHIDFSCAVVGLPGARKTVER
jgi:hypothetical protein